MELAFLNKNDKNKTKPPKIKKIFTISGLLSCILGIISLAIINVGIFLQDTNVLIILPQVFFIIGVLLGLFGLIGRKTYAWWGIGINAFTLFFTFVIKILIFFL